MKKLMNFKNRKWLLIPVMLTVLMTIGACSHWKPLKAPCTYYKRSNCGPIIPLQ